MCGSAPCAEDASALVFAKAASRREHDPSACVSGIGCALWAWVYARVSGGSDITAPFEATRCGPVRRATAKACRGVTRSCLPLAPARTMCSSSQR